MTHTTIVWFRRDLRIQDNPALFNAAERGDVLPVYIWDDSGDDPWALGGASQVWLHHALISLNESLQGKLQVFRGRPLEVLKELSATSKASALYWNRCYEPASIARDTEIKSHFKDEALETESFNGSLLWEPWKVNKADGSPYRVFTPFYRKGCLPHSEPRKDFGAPLSLKIAEPTIKSVEIGDLGLIPAHLSWPQEVAAHWDISEQGAQDRLANFLDVGLGNYKEGRNIPSKPFVSRLSAYLKFGLISPNQIWHAAHAHNLALGNDPSDPDLDHFCSELGWREFSYSLLYHNPDLPEAPIQKKFQHFAWRDDPEGLEKWRRGQTGCPIVDAGMRELYQTGFMHNRVRMIVGSFLVKNLLIHWHHGEEWFWDCLFDADLASNSASWQWISGCGADAAPYFRIFNPVTQGLKFDPDGEYVKKYCPELAHMPKKFIHCPWDAPELVLQEAGVKLGENYPELIADLKGTRERALLVFNDMKKQA